MLTALIATHNGAQTLPTVLDAYCQLEAPRGGWKLLIVNNASTDRTQKILDSYRSRLPLMAISEAAAGQSRALNTGLANVEGDLVVISDDDAVPHSDWLVQYRNAADTRPAFAVFGGAILPRWEAPPESWILPFYGTLAITDPTWEEGPIYPYRIYGGNMAIRTRVIEAGFRFDVSLGPIGSKYQVGVVNYEYSDSLHSELCGILVCRSQPERLRKCAELVRLESN
jgi:glycosyltransferase involved in cell wall biosynthesis